MVAGQLRRQLRDLFLHRMTEAHAAEVHARTAEDEVARSSKQFENTPCRGTVGTRRIREPVIRVSPAYFLCTRCTQVARSMAMASATIRNSCCISKRASPQASTPPKSPAADAAGILNSALAVHTFSWASEVLVAGVEVAENVSLIRPRRAVPLLQRPRPPALPDLHHHRYSHESPDLQTPAAESLRHCHPHQ
jgi:hypothetical protein